jgi:hypothetical protein
MDMAIAQGDVLRQLGQSLQVPCPWTAYADPEAFKALPLNAKGLVDTRPMFSNEPLELKYIGVALRAAWSERACNGGGQAELELSSGSLDLCHLAELILFLLSEVPLQASGHFFGLGCLLLRQFGHWLDNVLPTLLPAGQVPDIPSLRGCFGRSFRHDPRRLNHAITAMATGAVSSLTQWEKEHHTHERDDDKAKVIVCAYLERLRKDMAVANLSKCVTMDGVRAAGEPMEIFFSHSPVVNVGGWLPFQVIHPSLQTSH